MDPELLRWLSRFVLALVTYESRRTPLCDGDRDDLANRALEEVLRRIEKDASSPDGGALSSDRPHLRRLCRIVVRHRVVDWRRSQSCSTLRVVPADPDASASRNASPLTSVAQDDEVRYIRALLLGVCRKDSERGVVIAVLEGVDQGGDTLSLRRIGRHLFPQRPQRACELWADIVRRVSRELEERERSNESRRREEGKTEREP